MTPLWIELRHVPRPVTALRPGDRSLVVEQQGGRHVGAAVDARAVER